MTQLEIAIISVGAFALFMFGYSLGWVQRGSRLGSIVADVTSPESIDRFRGDVEARVRRSQQ